MDTGDTHVLFRFSPMNTLIEAPFNHLKLDFILSLSPGNEQGYE